MPALGRRVPSDWEHVERHALTVEKTVAQAERKLRDTKGWYRFYDQGNEGACVGFGASRMMSVLNRQRYDARWLWERARLLDEFTDNDDLSDLSQGTTVRAGCEVLRIAGHVIWLAKYAPNDPQARVGETPKPGEGISAYRWATTVDQIRTVIAGGAPVALGTNWYTDFDTPVALHGQPFVGVNSKKLGKIRGGHCYCALAVSDLRQAVGFANNWGLGYPQLTWLPYVTLQRLLDEQGEAALVTDR